MKYPDLFTRLVANTHEPETDRGCWLWSGRTDRKGYGFVNMRVEDRAHVVPHRAARVMEELVRGHNEFDLDDDPLGPIFFVPRPKLDPDAETIGHLCYTPGCINPDHWQLETRVENTMERNSRYA